MGLLTSPVLELYPGLNPASKYYFISWTVLLYYGDFLLSIVQLCSFRFCFGYCYDVRNRKKP